MIIKKGSKSALETYDNCQWDYYLKYNLGFKTPSGKSAILGTICHKVLEILARRTKANKITRNSIINDPEFLLTICFNKEVKNNPDAGILPNDIKDCRKWLSNILDTEHDPRRLKVLYIEHGFLLEFHRPGFKYEFNTSDGIISGQFILNGYIDFINEIEENGEKVLNITDYKFGKYATDWATGKEKTNETLSKDLQLRCYFLACRNMFPQYKKFKLTLIFVQLNKIFQCYMSDDDIAISIDDIRRRFKRIVNTEYPQRLIDDASRSQFHFKCKHVCHFGKTKDTNGKSLCEQYYREYIKNPDLFVELTIQGNSSAKKITRKPIENKIII